MILCNTKRRINQSISFHTMGKIVWLLISLTNVRERGDKLSSCPMNYLFLQLSLRHFQSKPNAICGMMSLCLEGHSNQHAAVALEVKTPRPQWFSHCNPRQPTQPPRKILIVQKQSFLLRSLLMLAPLALTNHLQLEALVATSAWCNSLRVSLMEGIPPAARISSIEQNDKNNRNRIITCLNITVPSKCESQWEAVCLTSRPSGTSYFRICTLKLKNDPSDDTNESDWFPKCFPPFKIKCVYFYFQISYHAGRVCIWQHGNIFFY